MSEIQNSEAPVPSANGGFGAATWPGDLMFIIQNLRPKMSELAATAGDAATTERTHESREIHEKKSVARERFIPDSKFNRRSLSRPRN